MGHSAVNGVNFKQHTHTRTDEHIHACIQHAFCTQYAYDGGQ